MKFINVLMDSGSVTFGDTEEELEGSCVIIPDECMSEEMFNSIRDGILSIYTVSDPLPTISVSRMIRELDRLGRWDVLVEESKTKMKMPE